MVVYIKLEPQEELNIKKAVLQAMASSVTFQDTGTKIAKLKKSKKYATRGMTKKIKAVDKEILKIKQALPQIQEMPELLKLRELQDLQGYKKVEDKAKKIDTKKKKTRYEIELEAIKEKIASLGI